MIPMMGAERSNCLRETTFSAGEGSVTRVYAFPKVALKRVFRLPAGHERQVGAVGAGERHRADGRADDADAHRLKTLKTGLINSRDQQHTRP